MGQLYGMDFNVTAYKPERESAIIKAIRGEWYFRPTAYLKASHGEICGYAEASLYEGEEEFAEGVARAVWEANAGYCEVKVKATYLEELPYETYSFAEDEYAEMTGKDGI
jgi:hypothetical protein